MADRSSLAGDLLVELRDTIETLDRLRDRVARATGLVGTLAGTAREEVERVRGFSRLGDLASVLRFATETKVRWSGWLDLLEQATRSTTPEPRERAGRDGP